MSNGIRTTNLERSFVIDELVGNITEEGVQKTARIGVPSLAMQMAANGPFVAGSMVVVRTRAQLISVTPEKETWGGLVLKDPDPTNNGYYSRAGGVWVWARGLPDTMARLIVSGGSANAVQAAMASGINPADVAVFYIQPSLTNTGAVTLSIDGGSAKPVLDVNGDALTTGLWVSGRLIMLVDNGTEYRLLSDPDIDGMLATAIALVEAAEQLATPGEGTVTPESLDDTRIDDFKSILGVTLSTAIGRSINGLLIANNSSTPDTRLDIGPGSCRDKDQTMDMIVSVGWSKSTAAWAAGNGNFGMLDTGTIAANKGYHLFVIFNPVSGLYDFLCSLSPTAPVLPPGFTKRRRIGAFVTGASAVIKPGLWYANGDFRFKDAFNVVSNAPGNFLTLAVMPIPIGIKLKIRGQVFGDSSAAGHVPFWMIIRDPDLGTIVDDVDQWYEAVGYKSAGGNDGCTFECWTDTSGQIYHVAYNREANYKLFIYLQGWNDLREEFA